jgi:tetratricopeptide (TPR) repeat protein
MARKLSHIVTGAVLFAAAVVVAIAATNLSAEDEKQATTAQSGIENPFRSAKAKPRTVIENAHPTRRAPVVYQNPFSGKSASPPVDTSLRPGPVSRWIHATLPEKEILLAEPKALALQACELTVPIWDQLPRTEKLHLAPLPHIAPDPSNYGEQTRTLDAIRFAPRPLMQPTWMTCDSRQALPDEPDSLQSNLSTFIVPQNATRMVQQVAATSVDPVQLAAPQLPISNISSRVIATLTADDTSPTIVSDSVDSAEIYLAKAQHTASIANSPDDLTLVINACDRGLRAAPNENISSSLRRLAAWAHNRRGELQADSGRSDDSLADFQTAIALDPKCSLAIHNRAVSLAQQKQFEAALRDFDRVIELNPGLAVAYRNRAELLTTLGRMQEAIADYNQAIENLPNDDQLYRGRGYAYQRLGDYQQALADLNRSIQLVPNNPDALTQRGNLAAEQGRFKSAIDDFRRALSTDPNWDEAHRSLAWLEATCPDAQFQNPKKAIVAAEMAARLGTPGDYLILDTLAAAYASDGQFDKAIEVQQKAIAGAPPESMSAFEQRLSLYRIGRPFRNVSASPGASGR